ncbi:MAG: hypothetical protein IKY91_05530 [Akkermansia sp.]|nr:hypothetical protein [Akkermansia sp.]
MKKLTFALLAAGIMCSCQQAQRPVIQTEVPIFTAKEVDCKGKKRGKKRIVTEATLVTVSGPVAMEWDMFDRTDAVMKYNKMSLSDKELLFGTIIRVYSNLPKKNTFSSESINIGIWKEVTEKGVDLSFGTEPTDWHPYLMYIHPLAISEMADFFLQARKENISDAELNQWQKALCNLINAGPDTLTAAAILVRKDALAKAGVIIKEDNGVIFARSTRINWDKYRAEKN